MSDVPLYAMFVFIFCLFFWSLLYSKCRGRLYSRKSLRFRNQEWKYTIIGIDLNFSSFFLLCAWKWGFQEAACSSRGRKELSDFWRALKMHIFFEPPWNGLKETDSRITCLSWMGKVPEEVPDSDEWQLNRQDYYREGWLATGNIRATVGVTYTSTFPKDIVRFPPRTNFNLRGHRAKITIAQWNEPYQKLATCDSSGVIFVWIRYEGRWSIELINDRNTPVVHFQWSHDGRMALICYKDGFVLVGSVAGQRYWSSMMNLDSELTYGLWTPDDQNVYLTTAKNDLLVLNIQGVMVSRGTTAENPATEGDQQEQPHVIWMSFNCPKFKMEEIDSDAASPAPQPNPPPPTATLTASTSPTTPTESYILAALDTKGKVKFMKAHDDPAAIVVETGLTDVKCEWSNSGLYLAICGTLKGEDEEDEGRIELRFYRPDGSLAIKVDQFKQEVKGMVGSLTWGHNDQRLFFSVGRQIIVGWVWGAQSTQPEITPLQLLASVRTFQLLPPLVAANLQQYSKSFCYSTLSRRRRQSRRVKALPLPATITNALSTLASPTIQSNVPDSREKVREFVTRPPKALTRLYCTMLREDSFDFFPVNGPSSLQNPSVLSGTTYTLYLEFLGGLLPLLKGKRISRLRPDFLIYDPNPSISETSEVLKFDKKKKKKRINSLDDDEEDGDSMASLPESDGLAVVLSNIWGTKFRIAGLVSSVPEDLGHVLYRTSLLHLQPRQMTIILPELGISDPSLGSYPRFSSTSTSANNFSLALQSPTHTSSLAGTPLETEKRVSLAPVVNETCRTSTATTVVAGCVRSQSEGVLNIADSWTNTNQPGTSQRRFYFSEQQQEEEKAATSPQRLYPKLRTVGKSHSLDSSPTAAPHIDGDVRSFMLKLSQNYQRMFSDVKEEDDAEITLDEEVQEVSKQEEEEQIVEAPWSESSSEEASPVHGAKLLCGGSSFSRSLPSTPLMKQKFKDYVSSPIKNSFLASPIMSRRFRKQSKDNTKVDFDSDYLTPGSPSRTERYLSQKLGRWNRTVPARGMDMRGTGGPGGAQRGSGRQYVLFNKAPIWNENSQVYQLDFGGRVTQESAKNFQIEHENSQVMQFGRVDTNAYTLDFQHPFSAVQAFAISLANVTQRLK